MDASSNLLLTTYGYNVDFLGGCGWNPHVSWLPGHRRAVQSEIADAAGTILVFDATYGNMGVHAPWRAQSYSVSQSLYAANNPMSNVCNDGTSAYGCTLDWFPRDRHLEGMNVAFTDGHVKWMKKEAVIYKPAGFDGNIANSYTDPKYLWNRN